ncbi:hypothetical protein MZC73_17190, partial [Escherichia coli]|nr:hypothetical protein [Escherichia coli]MCQ5892057.1 hypothetical protein [Escherichia coli]MCQ5897234.1 hypothetical protein [Escherichia coli]MCQ5903752.1 hypothetical protein [Escherichia coli]MCQ5922509.1 hypothetical protein [Escherichia coli]
MTRDDRFLTSTSGYISPEQLPELLKEIIRAIQRLFRFLEQRERNNAPVLICKDCGYYERIGFAPIFPDTCYHLTHYWPAAADIPVASDNPVHYADAIRYNAR